MADSGCEKIQVSHHGTPTVDHTAEDGSNKEDDEEAFEEDDNTGIPTDEGFSWVICACAFSVEAVTMGHHRCLSTWFVDVSETFRVSTTVTSLSFTLFSFFTSLSSLLVSNILFPRVTTRSVCVVAGLLNGLITIFISMSPNITVWLCLYAIKGIPLGALMVSPLSLIGYYFKKRRSLASAFSSSGIVAAAIIFPTLASFLRIEYGLRGAMLILGAIEMHVIPVGMLLRPVASYRRVYKRKRGTAMRAILSGQETTEEKQPLNDTESTQFLPLDAMAGASITSDVLPRERSHSVGKQCRLKTKLNDAERSKSQGSGLENGDVDVCLHRGKRTGDDVLKLVPKLGRRTESIASGSILGASLAGSIMDILPIGAMQSGSEEANDPDTDGRPRPISCRVSTFIDTSLLKLWTLRMIVANQALSSFTNFILIYMPAIAFQAGISKPEAALLLTIGGCMDLVVRVIVGLVADKKWISKENMIAGSLLVVALAAHFARFYTNYTAFVLFALIVGIFAGFRQNLLAPILLDYFGAEKAPKALGIDIMCAAMAISFNHPVVGALADATGNFLASLHYVGTVILVSILILLTHPVCKRWDAENERKAQLAAQAQAQDV